MHLKMKKISIRYIQYAIVLSSVLSLVGCTKKFEDFNTNPLALTNEQTLRQVATAIGPIEKGFLAGFQISQNLSGDAYAGYMMSPTPFAGDLNNLNYALVAGWNDNPMSEQYKLVMAPVKKIGEAGARTNAPDIWGVALTCQVYAMHRVTDKFGPIPYTKTGTSFDYIPYDDQKTVYNEFFKHLDTAVNNMRAFLASSAPIKNKIGNSDFIYQGKLDKWIKFANSLRLRLAMRIAKVDPATAKTQGEIALAAPEGILMANTDNAILTSGAQNDYWIVTSLYNRDNMLNASFGTYLNGYSDPRASKMVLPATQASIAGKYTGMRLGCDPSKGDYKTFATFNYTDTYKQYAPYVLMTAAEMWFLKAEAALRGWAGAGDAKTNYETGIQTSMDQWGVPIGSYLSDATSKQEDYVDPLNATNNISALSAITIKWDDGATNEQKLERIITQKWLAIFPDGLESWAEFRRTGYPKLFPVARNFSNGTIDTEIQIRRLPFATAEKTANKAFSTALTALNGPDNGGTRLWWDKAGPNF
jgi:hypothetical protein